MALSLKQEIVLPCGMNAIKGVMYWFNNDPNYRIFIPYDPLFSLIKMYVLDGNGLYASYTKAGDSLYLTGSDNCDLEKFPGYPDSAIAMPVKFYIYDSVDLWYGKSIPRPYGDGVWLHEQVSKILEMYFLGAQSKKGRLELEPGIILPTQAEQTCIRNAMRYDNLSITDAFNKCGCPEILPTKYLADIQTIIKSSSYTMFYSYMIAITKSQIPLPEQDGDGTTPPTPPKNDLTKYLPLGLLAILLLMQRGN